MSNLTRRIAAVLSMTLLLAIVPLPTFAATDLTAAPAVVAPAAIPAVDLKCVTFVDASTGFAAGANGTIIKTTDGGENWVPLNTGTTTADFRGLAFWSTTTGIAVTYNRAIYKTTNGGTSWTLANADMTEYAVGTPPIGVSGMTSVPGSSDAAMLFGGTTINDGLHLSEQAWRTQTYGGVYFGTYPWLEPKAHLFDDGLGNTYSVGDGEILAIDFTDATHAWAVGDDLYPAEDTSTVHASTNGGFNWTRQAFPVALRLTGVSFANNSIGVTVSNEGRIFRTANGGTTWTEASTVPAPLTALTSVGMNSASSGWAVGTGGKLLRTTDGGAVWANATSPTFLDLAAITFVGNHGVAVGKSGAVIVTDDGVTWHLPSQGGGVDLTPPVMTTLTSASHPVEASWYSTANASFTWGATDASGVVGYSYVLDSSPSTLPDETSEGSATSALVVAPEGLRYLHVRAVDPSGNWSTTALHRAVRTDRTKPSTTDNHVASYTGAASITLTRTDPLSGVQKTEWSLNGAPLQTGTSVPVSLVGDYTLTYASTDNAGNRETTKTATFAVVAGPVEVPAVPIQGTSRYLTAIAASQLAFPVDGTTPAVVLATGTNWPDALGGAALAGEVGGPILLTDPNTLSSDVRAEITRLGATTAYVLGSEAAVSKPVADAIEGMSGVSVVRLAGSNRYSTARAIAERVVTLQGGSTNRTFFVATGSNFPDALAASPLAAAKGWPLFLVGPSGLSASDLAYMDANGDGALILGSESAVSAPVQTQLNTTFGTVNVERLAGGDRYATGLAIVDYATGPEGGLNWATPAIATGTNFPDALSGGVLQGLDGSILLLTNGTTLTPSVGAAITEHATDITEVRYLGSTSAVSSAVRTAIQALVN